MIEQAVLDRVPFLASLNAAAKRELAARAVLRRFAPGAVLWRAGAAPRGVFIVLEGEVRVVRTAGGRRHVIHSEGAGGTLGDVALFRGGPYPATAIAARRTLCLVLSREAIHAAMRADPELAFALLGRLAERVGHLIERLDRRAEHVPARLAAYLLARSERVGAGTFTLGGTQLEVAEELGTAREVVVRALRTLRDAALIRAVGRGRFEIVDRAGLARLAGGGRSA